MCSFLLFIALADLPIGYYTFLRIVITVASVIVVFKDLDKGFNFWTVSFGLLAILFNPIIPIYLNSKEYWMPIDFIAASIFAVKFLLEPKINNSKT